jgi:2-polyprenyl-6-methoxyphenol hydroxylase-like FAD-dependent oxidoreductase
MSALSTLRKALVVGGGIGGMCAAIELAKRGVAVDLAEQHPEGAPDGAGITLSGPTLRALQAVGVLPEVLASGGVWTHLDVCAPNGTVVATVPMQAPQGADDLACAAGIMRPLLAGILAKATRAAGVRVRLGTRLQSFSGDAQGVDVRFADGQTARYALLVAADGLHSAVRAQCFPDFPAAQFTGQGCWRAVVPRTREHSTMFMGATTKAGLNPVSASHCYLFTLDKRPGLEFVDPAQGPRLLAELLGEFGGAMGEVRAGLLNGAIEQPRILYRPLAGHVMPAPWHVDRVVLLGDAVHATTPHLASGAGIAVEAALILAEELARHATVQQALAAYATRHHARAHRVVSSSVRLGQIEQTGGSKDEHMQVMTQALQALRAPI